MRNRHEIIKTAIQLSIYLSKVEGKLYVAMDGNLLDASDFGINPEKFRELGSKIDDVIHETLGYKKDDDNN